MPTFVNSSTASGLTTSPAVSAPAGVASGDFQLVILGIGTGGESVTQVPTGWTEVAGMDNTDANDSFEIRCYVSTTDTGTATWTKSGSRAWHLVRVAWSDHGGADASEYRLLEATTGQAWAIPTTTVDVANSLVIGAVFADGAASQSFTPPTNWTERVDYFSSDENGCITVAELLATSTGTVDGSFTAAQADTSEGIVFAMVLQPGGPAPINQTDQAGLADAVRIGPTSVIHDVELVVGR